MIPSAKNVQDFYYEKGAFMSLMDFTGPSKKKKSAKGGSLQKMINAKPNYPLRRPKGGVLRGKKK